MTDERFVVTKERIGRVEAERRLARLTRASRLTDIAVDASKSGIARTTLLVGGGFGNSSFGRDKGGVAGGCVASCAV